MQHLPTMGSLMTRDDRAEGPGGTPSTTSCASKLVGIWLIYVLEGVAGQRGDETRTPLATSRRARARACEDTNQHRAAPLGSPHAKPSDRSLCAARVRQRDANLAPDDSGRGTAPQPSRAFGYERSRLRGDYCADSVQRAFWLV